MNAKISLSKYARLCAGFAAVSTVGLLAVSGRPAHAQTASRAKNASTNATPAAPYPADFGSARIPYKGRAFDRFVVDSYKEAGLSRAQAETWYAWMDGAYQKSGVRFSGKETIKSLGPLMDSIGKDYDKAQTVKQKAQMERKTGAFVHKMVKTAIPKFSLDRGFEFAEAMRRGERQCYLQAILVSGLMQRAHMRASVVMVSKSDKGEATNNGHCVALVKCSDKRDVLVDISHPDPFVAQQGLMVADTQTGAFRYVTPQYDAHENITGYTSVQNGASVPVSRVRGLGYGFLLSQFDYYRGERAPGGFVDSKKTPAGLAASVKYLQKSVRECPQNPLAQYVLGRVYLRQGKTSAAKAQIETAYRVYNKAGWIPQGEKDALVLVKSSPQTLSMR